MQSQQSLILIKNQGFFSADLSYKNGLDDLHQVPKNWCFWIVVLEKTLESPLDCKEIQPVHSKGNQSWILIGGTDAEAEAPNTLATWCEEGTHQNRPWYWERLKAGGEGDNTGRNGWMTSPAQWTSVLASSGWWWKTAKPGVLQSMGLQRVGNNWATEQQQQSILKIHLLTG